MSKGWKRWTFFCGLMTLAMGAVQLSRGIKTGLLVIVVGAWVAVSKVEMQE